MKKKVDTEINNLGVFQSKGTKIPFVMVHGELLNYSIPKIIGQDRPYLGYVHVGSNGEEIPFQSVSEMVEVYVKRLIAIKPQGPYILGGYSYGGVLAYEMAIKLKKMGKEVPKLLIFDSIYPGLKEGINWERGWKKLLKYDLIAPHFYCFIRNVDYGIAQIYFKLDKRLPARLRKKYIWKKYDNLLKKYNHTSEWYDGEMLLFRVSSNDKKSPSLGWEQISNHITIVKVGGEHHNFLSNPQNVRTFQHEIRDFIGINL